MYMEKYKLTIGWFLSCHKLVKKSLTFWSSLGNMQKGMYICKS